MFWLGNFICILFLQNLLENLKKNIEKYQSTFRFLLFWYFCGFHSEKHSPGPLYSVVFCLCDMGSWGGRAGRIVDSFCLVDVVNSGFPVLISLYVCTNTDLQDIYNIIHCFAYEFQTLTCKFILFYSTAVPNTFSCHCNPSGRSDMMHPKYLFGILYSP